MAFTLFFNFQSFAVFPRLRETKAPIWVCKYILYYLIAKTIIEKNDFLNLQTMNIVVDIGNTFIKAAVFDEQQIVWQTKNKPIDFLKNLQAAIEDYSNIDNLLYSSSGQLNSEILQYFNEHFNVIKFNQDSPIPFNNSYETPKTLGLDRIALIAAANNLYPKKNVLVIDAGTCITYDLITKNQNYIGGNISPGIDMRFKALHYYTANLPRLKQEQPKTFPLGKNTKDAMLNGVTQGVIFEIDQNIERYTTDYKDLTVILTGGDEQYLSTQLKNSIFANSNFQLVGLNAILEFLLND